MRLSLFIAGCLVVSIGAFFCGPLRAVTIQAEIVGIPFSTSAQAGSFEVFISGDVAGEPDIAAHQLRVSLASPASGISFDGAGVTANRAYLGPNSAPTTSVSPHQLDSADFTLFDAVPLFDNAGLVRVDFTLPASLPIGTYDLVVSPDPQFTFLSDGNGLDLSIALIDGAIRVVMPGDYDWDNDVDGFDFLKWQGSFGSTEELMADGNRDGTVNVADYAIWEGNYGASLFGSAVAVHVPESTTLIQLSQAIAIVLFRPRSRSKYSLSWPKACEF